MIGRRFVVVAAFLLVALTATAHAAVAGIDLGSEHFKVVVVRPGSLDIALNEASGRKSATAIGFAGEERLLGDSAASQATKSPQTVFTQFTSLLGRQINAEDAWFQELKKQQPWVGKATIDAATKQLSVQLDESTTFSLEEILAQVLAYAGQIAASSAGHTVKDVAITVPNYFTQAQRQAVIDSAKMANLNVLALINQGAALALQYGIERTFEPEKPQYVIFYDMGASDLQVSLFKFTGALDKKNKPVGGAQLVAQAWDETLGGRTFDQKLVEYFLKEIEGKGHKLDGKGLVKLQRAVKKAKEVLSANKESHISIESLTSDFDFRSVVTREIADELFAPLFERSVEPLKRVLATAGLEPSQIEAIELFGGGVRIPKLQDKLREFMQREQLDKHMNGDEAAVFGAALHAASVSAQHRTREFRMKDAQLSHFPVLVTKEGDETETSTSDDSAPNASQTETQEDQQDGEDAAGVGSSQIRDMVLFKPTSRYGGKRTLEFNGYSNFSIVLNYGAEGASYIPGTDLNIASYEVSGIPQADQYNMTARPRIQVKFALSNSGVVSLTKAYANISFSVQREVEVPKAKPVSEEVKSDETSASTEENAQETAGETKAEAADATDASEKKEETAEAAPAVEEKPETEKVIKIVQKSLNLPLNVKAVKEAGLSADQIKAGKKKLDQLDEKDRARKETDKAKNAVESFVYDTRDKIYTDEVVAMSTETEREELSAALSTASDWLDDEGADATKSQYQDKLRELQKQAEKIMTRVKEATARPQAVEDCLAIFNLTRAIAENITAKFEVTEEERDGLIQKVAETEEWLNSSIAEQAKLEPFQDPSVLSSDINRKCQDIQFRVRVLLKRPIRRPKPKPKPVQEKSKSDEEKAPESTENQTASDSQTEEKTEQPRVTEAQQEPTETTEQDQTQTPSTEKKDEL